MIKKNATLTHLMKISHDIEKLIEFWKKKEINFIWQIMHRQFTCYIKIYMLPKYFILLTLTILGRLSWYTKFHSG